MMLYEAVPPVGPLFIPALGALFALAALLFAIGLLKLLDGFVRALFGTAEGVIGWVPFAGRVVKHSLHRIEQKISHLIGRAERQLDAAVALSWHNLARLVAWMGNEIAGVSEAAWHLAQQAKSFVRHRDVTHEVRAATKPLRAKDAQLGHAQAQTAAQTKAVAHSVAAGVYPRLKVGEAERAQVLNPGLTSARAQARAAEEAAIASYKYLTSHRRSVIAGVFTGAVAWALTRVGAGWVRCANWRKIGRRVCRMPMSDIDSLLALFITAEAIANLPTLVRIMQGVAKETAEGIKDLADV